MKEARRQEESLMDSTSLSYFRELCKDLNMHRTAERMYVSQQTISNHIMKLEEELGCRLFDRKPSLALTFAGQQVLRFADEVVFGRRNLMDSLSDIASEERGSIRFGASRMRLNACLPGIMPQFLKRYPNVEVKLEDKVEKQLEALVHAGEVDIGVIVAVSDETDLVVEPLMDDQVYVCVPDGLLRDACGEQSEDVKRRSAVEADLRAFADIPFCMFENRLGQVIRHCFEDAGVSPKVCMTSSYMQVAAAVGFQGTAAFFATQMGIMSQREMISRDLNIFPLFRKGEPVYHRIYLIRHRRRYLPAYTRHFSELLHRHYAEIGKEHVGRIA
jgi:DNA-binding transcriptional LysR family regulator